MSSKFIILPQFYQVNLQYTGEIKQTTSIEQSQILKRDYTLRIIAFAHNREISH